MYVVAVLVPAKGMAEIMEKCRFLGSKLQAPGTDETE
jgi:hypothetical protein